MLSHLLKAGVAVTTATAAVVLGKSYQGTVNSEAAVKTKPVDGDSHLLPVDATISLEVGIVATYLQCFPVKQFEC